jgi:UDP-glucose 4-epimerase
MSRYQISGIINLAALKSVEESEIYPEKYELVNHLAVRGLLDSAKLFGVKYFIQSSTAAVYGNSSTGFATESDELFPISQYGKTKRSAEDELNEAIDSNSLKGISLRYFNVLGSSTPDLKDRSTANIVPMVLDSLRINKTPRIFGGDYPTHDGTCIRDYVHVEDIARAHVLAVTKLRTNQLPKVINVGTGSGFSVREVITEILRQKKSILEPTVVERRKGDPSILVAKIELAQKVLGFEAKKTLEEMIASSIW